MYQIERYIEVDTAHRVPDHESKCRNLHGHRYRITMVIEGPDLRTSGSDNGMIVDFGFMKTMLMEQVDALMDHGTVLWYLDPILIDAPPRSGEVKVAGPLRFDPELRPWLAEGKLWLSPLVPTAENLAKMLFDRLEKALWSYTVLPEGTRLLRVVVQETEKCVASFTRGGQ